MCLMVRGMRLYVGGMHVVLCIRNAYRSRALVHLCICASACRCVQKGRGADDFDSALFWCCALSFWPSFSSLDRTVIHENEI